MAALVIALLLAFAGALLRTDHFRRLASLICGSASAFSAMATRYLIIAVAVLLCAVALLYMVDYESLTPTTATTLFQIR